MINNPELLSEKQIIATKEAINKHPKIEEMEIDFDDLLQLYKKINKDLPDLTEKDLVEDMLELGEQIIAYSDEDDLGTEDIIMIGAILISEDLFNPKIISNKMLEDAKEIIKQDFNLDFTELFELFEEKNPDLSSLNLPSSPKIILEDSFKKPDFLKIILKAGDYELGESDEFAFYNAVIAGTYILFGRELSL